jgi:protein-S-isoprenylcysteine O-methyltransferase Ste14
MALKDQFERSGGWLFRWRSYLPLLAILVLIEPMLTFHYLLGSHGWDNVWDVLCVFISMTGLAIRVKTIGHTPVGTSGRNTKYQVADVLNTTGMYSVVRHPLYLGNCLMWLGLAVFPHAFSAAALIMFGFFLYYERIMFAEEAFLRERFGEEFEQWAARTPAFIPRLSRWRPPSLPFSWRNILKREYSGFYALVCLFTTLEVLGEYQVERRLGIDIGWAVFFCAGTSIYITFRTLKKHTRLLHVEGR